MKKVFVGLSLLGILVACNRQADVAPQETADVKVAYQKSVQVAGTSVDLKVAEVTDSRCPINARCVAAGSVRVNFEANEDGKSTPVSVDLPAYPDKPVQQVFSLNGQSYRLTLREVLPYPEVGVPVELKDYTVQFSLEKQ